MFKVVSLLLVVLLCYTNAAKDIFYSHIPSYEREYAVIQNTNHRTGEISDPVTIELRNPKCYPRACDYGSRITTQENIVFVYSHQQRLYTTNRCKLGRDYLVVKKVEVNPISCDINFCLSHGIGIAAVRSCGTEYCECRSTGVAILRSCSPGFVFSPQYMTCDYEHKVYGCVLARRQRK